MDQETKAFLLGAYEFLKKHQEMLNEVMIETFVLRKTIRDLGPEAEKIYTKHYLAEHQGPLKTEGDGATEALAELIRRLS